MLKRFVLLIHSDSEIDLAAEIARPIQEAGYEVIYGDTVLVGESLTGAASKVLTSGGPLVICGTVNTVGTGLARRLVYAARQDYQTIRVFVLQIEQTADVQELAQDGLVGRYWRDKNKAIRDLIASLNKHYPLSEQAGHDAESANAEERYKKLALETCDIIDLANLPEMDRNLASRSLELRRLYVALRVSVHSSHSETSDEDLKRIEQQRDAARYGHYVDDSIKRISIGELLKTSRRVIVLGDPGAGKTTLLRWIATAYLLKLKNDPDWIDIPDVASLPDENWLPIFVRCRDLDQACLNGTLSDVLKHTLRKAEMTEQEALAIQPLLQEKLRDGQAILLLDGLDEIADPAIRSRFCRQLESIHIAYPNATIIATSRIVGYREAGHRIGRGFEHVTVSDLSPNEKNDFATRWCNLTELPERRETAIRELIRDIHSGDRVERLTGNPMLLTTMALVKRKVGKLPSRRHELYWEAVQVLLNWRNEVDLPIDHHEAVPQLEYLAYAMCERGVQQLREDEILDLLTQMRKDYIRLQDIRSRTPSEFLKAMERRTGILIEAGFSPHLGMSVPVYEFRHLTFQEYLAARALVDGRFPGRNKKIELAEYVGTITSKLSTEFDGIKQRNFNENWREALRLVVAMCGDDDIDGVLMAIYDSSSKGVTFQFNSEAPSLALACLTDDPDVLPETADVIIQDFIGSISVIVNKSKTETAFEIISEDLWGILSQIGMLRYSRWLFPIRNALVQEFIENDVAISEIYADLYVNSLMFLQHSASLTTSELNKVDSIELLSDDAEAVSFSLNVVAAMFIDSTREFVEELGVHKVASVLLLLLHRGRVVAHAAAWAIFALVNPDEDGKCLWTPDDKQNELLATEAWRRDGNNRSRDWCARALSATHHSECIKFCANMVQDKDARSRFATISILNELPGEKSLSLLLTLLRDPIQQIQEAAADAIANISDDKTVEVLLQILENGEETLWSPVSNALHQIAGNVYVEKGVDLSLPLFSACVSRCPTDAMRNNYAFCLIEKGEFSEALFQFSSMTSWQSSDMASLWLHNLALTNYSLGLLQEASETMTRARLRVETHDNHREKLIAALVIGSDKVISPYYDIHTDTSIMLNSFMMGLIPLEELRHFLEANCKSDANRLLDIVLKHQAANES